ncbi:MAG: protein kinase [Chitinispirillaceae bacterium]|nr:protein kinase [Chitinispirillaceae bacterium]
MMAEPKIPRESVKGNVYIRNMLANIERTFLPIGTTVGKYRIMEEIDRGGMAVVYKAVQLDLDREVALKVMPSNISINRRFMERFMSEAHAIARLSHANIVSIYEVAMHNSIYYLAMEYIPGQNLFYYLNFNKPKLIDVLEIVSKLADALNYAHQQKIIHRDLKLNNVIMRDKLTPVLIDFGLAKALEDEAEGGITRTGEVMGSPSYMAPERLLGGAVDHRSDVCSLGIMLYEMLTFKNPYLDQRNLHQTALNVMEANPIPPRKLVPWLPREIEAITLKAMAKDPETRYQSMEEFKADINRYQRNEPVLAQPPSIVLRLSHFFRRYWPLLSIITTVIVFSTLFALSLYIQNQKGMSHWQLFHSERFGNRLDPAEWLSWPRPDEAKNDSAFWFVRNNNLISQSDRPTFLRFERRFNHDIKIEFEVGPVNKDLYNVGFFLFGDRPDSAYGFHLNRNGTGACGITFPGSTFLFQQTDGARINLSAVNHIVIQRIQHSITFSINGTVVVKMWDFLPPLGKNHERLGFFVRGGGTWFDNLRIYRRAIPATPSPMLVAERFWERGDFEAALEEFRALLVDFKNSERAREIQLKMADCQYRLGRTNEALETLRQIGTPRGKDESVGSRKYFLEGVIYEMLKEETSADSVFRLLATDYPASAANYSAMAFEIMRVAGYIRKGKLDLAEREITLFASQYSRFGDLWGRLGLMVMEAYRKAGFLDSALAVGQRVVASQDKSGDLYTASRIALGKINLDKGKKEAANELFNQCITAHTSSEGVWEAWMGLAGIYECHYHYPEATTIYQKVHRECPAAYLSHWMAALKLGELGSRDSQQNYARFFESVARGPHPFPLPRLIALFYLGEVNESRFKAVWNQLYPNDYSHLFYFARKAMFKKEEVVARIYLEDLKQNVPSQSWHYFVAHKAVADLKNW